MRKPQFLFFIQFLFVPLFLKAQIITTIAGDGVVANTGDGGQAITASISYPIGGVFDKYENYYFTTGIGGNSIRKISADGIISTVAGTGISGYSGDGGLAINAELNNPQAVTVDTVGNIFIADATNNCIRRVDILTGIITTVTGNGSAGDIGDGGPATSAQLFDPLDLCFDHLGNLFIADFGNNRIRKISPSGIITTFAGTGIPGHSGNGGLALLAEISPFGLTIDDTGNLYIADVYSVRKVLLNGNIVGFAGNGTPGYTGDGGLAINAEVTATKVYFDHRTHELFLTDHNDNRVRKVNAGMITKVAGISTAGYGGDGGPAILAQFHGTFGITTDTCGNLYIADGNNRRIRKVTFNDTCGLTNTMTINKLTSSIDVYPNPAYSILTIASTTKLKELSLVNLLRQQVGHQNINSQKTEVDVSQLANGIYFLTVTDANGEKVVKKIIKE